MEITETDAARPRAAQAEWDRVIATLDRGPADGMNLAHECCARWATDAGRTALVVRHPEGGSERYSYADLEHASARAAGAFAAAGLRRGDKVAAVLSRQVEAWVAALAAWRSGLVYVPLFCGFGPEALGVRMKAADVDAVVVDARWRDAVEDARPLLARDPTIFTVTGRAVERPSTGDRCFWTEVRRATPAGPAVETRPDEPATIMFTSGTTSAPKGCVMTHTGVVAVLPWLDHCCGLGDDDVLFATTDPGWSFGLLSTGAAPMLRGIARVIYTGDFDAAAWFDVMAAERVTHVAAVPTAFRALIDHAGRGSERTLPALTGATSAGEPLDEDTVRGWRELTGGLVRDSYGLTELGFVLANLSRDRDRIAPGALCSVVPGWEAALLGPDGRLTDGPGLGQLLVRRTPFALTRTYLDADDAWRARWRDGEWFETSDVFRRDEDGRWWFVGRDDDVIVTAGYNVGPAEIESVLLAHPAVADAAVVAAPDAKRGGSAVRAVIVLAPGRLPSEELTQELQATVRAAVGRHAYPRIVDYVDALPRTETGKLRRVALRARPDATPKD